MSFLKHKRKEMTGRLAGKRTKLTRCLYASAAIAVILSGIVTQTTTHVLAAPPINGTHNSVGVDPDAKRTAFEDAAMHPDANKTFTSVTIKTPDEVVNDTIYKDAAIANGTYKTAATLSEFLEAWKDGGVTYIEVTGDIPDAGVANGERKNGASVVIQGNGHTVDIGNSTLKLEKITSNTTITMSNIKVLQDLKPGTAETLSLFNTNSGIGTNLSVNLHDVSLSPSALQVIMVQLMPYMGLVRESSYLVPITLI